MSLTLAAVLSILLVIIAAVFLLLYWALIYRPHPRIEGRLHLPGLQAPVEVVRDRWGVPHIYAKTERDLWFAQGFVHAQDRLWQMEEARRVAAGRISEGVGEEGIEIDRLARIVGFHRTAQVQVEHLNDDARTVLESYTSGVNAFISKYHNRLPMEFTLLGIKPEPWTATDTLGIGLLLGWALTNNWREELVRVGFYARLGPQRASELLPDYAGENPLILPGEPLAVPVISALKKWSGPGPVRWEILDCPPGASCPVVEAVRGADFLLLVTEPTIFGLHDLTQAVEVGKTLGIKVGVVINREGIGQADVAGYCAEEGIPVFFAIPLDQEIGEGLARGKSLLAIKPEYKLDFERLLIRIAHAVGELPES